MEKEQWKFAGRLDENTYVWEGPLVDSRIKRQACDIEWFWNPWRVYWKQLVTLSEDGRACEICDQHPWMHVWMDLDPNGFAYNCSIESDRESGRPPL